MQNTQTTHPATVRELTRAYHRLTEKEALVFLTGCLQIVDREHGWVSINLGPCSTVTSHSPWVSLPGAYKDVEATSLNRWSSPQMLDPYARSSPAARACRATEDNP